MRLERYAGFKQVPAELKTNTAWLREGLVVRDGAEPVAQVFTVRYGRAYDLFDRSCVEPKHPSDPAAQEIEL